MDHGYGGARETSNQGEFTRKLSDPMLLLTPDPYLQQIQRFKWHSF